MKKTVVLHLEKNFGNSVQDLGFHVTWDNDNFKFDSFKDLGIFDVLGVNQVEGENKIVLAASSSGDPISENIAFAELVFDDNDDSGNVLFKTEKISAEDENGVEFDMINETVDIILETQWTIKWIWQ